MCLKRQRGSAIERWVTLALFTAITVAAGPAAAQSVDPAVGEADGKFIKVAAAGDTQSLAPLLDNDLQWTDSNGKTVDRPTVTTKVPAVAITTNDRTSYGYGSVAVVQANEGKLHALRVWIKRPAGWRLLVYQEVRSLDAPAAAGATPSVGSKCENPCGTVPYVPKGATDREVMKAYTSLEEAAMGGKAKEWSEIAADEIALVSSNSDRVFDKPTRAAAIAKATLGGVAPTKLLSARLFDFGTAVVMTSQHQSDRGQLIHITRVWVKRDGRWQETLSYQTAIRGAAAAR
jgi:hypothetical protein